MASNEALLERKDLPKERQKNLDLRYFDDLILTPDQNEAYQSKNVTPSSLGVGDFDDYMRSDYGTFSDHSSSCSSHGISPGGSGTKEDKTV